MSIFQICVQGGGLYHLFISSVGCLRVFSKDSGSGDGPKDVYV